MTEPMSEKKSRELAYYASGPTPFYACAYDQRFSYCLYVPPMPSSGRYRLVVLVHGTNRPAEGYRDAFSEFGRSHDAIIMAPLFPANISGPGDLSGYKRIRHEGIAYDNVLLAMVDEVRAQFPTEERFFLHGFSGGGHFAHRFLYAHPRALSAVSIGAPGIVTLLDEEVDWPIGTRNFAELFGEAPDRDAIARVPTQVVVGGQDTETWEISLRPGDGWWQPGAEWQQDATRIVRAVTLTESLRASGCEVQFDLIPGVAHNGRELVPSVQGWMSKLIQIGQI
ncbi:alpha/beta hydrolase [Cribrihabitans sp. XS_ASV171]